MPSSLTYYSTFGSPMPTRQWSDPNSKYKYGFNGKEKDNEINIDGGSYDFGARIYDSRLGRWLSLDPVRSIPWSNYVPFKCSPICIIDPNGETDFYNEGGDWIGTDGNEKTSTEIKIITDSKLRKIIEKTSKKGEDYKGTLPNGTFSTLPEKKVLDAIISVFDASQKNVVGENGFIIANGGEHESATTFDKDNIQTPIVNGPQMTSKTAGSAMIPISGIISIHSHIMSTVLDNLNKVLSANQYGPSTEPKDDCDVNSFKGYETNIIIQPNSNIEVERDNLTGIPRVLARHWVVSIYNSSSQLKNEFNYTAIEKITNGIGKSKSKTFKKYESAKNKANPNR